MLELIDIDEACDHLRLDSVGSDIGWLVTMIPAVSQGVALWLKDEWRLYVPERDSSGEVVLDEIGNPVPAKNDHGEKIVQPVVRAAVLMELESAYRFRGGEGKDNVVTPDAGYGYTLNKASTALLQALRKPTVA